MKTGTYKSVLLISTAFAILLASCSKEPIFASIEREIALRDASVEGFVTSIVATDEHVYAANGHIYRRSAGDGNWDNLSTPDGTGRAQELATDGVDLYALFLSESGNDSELFYLDESDDSWTAVTGASGITKIGNGDGEIYAFTGKSENEVNAYRTTTPGSTALTLTTATNIDLIVGSSGGYFATENTIYDSTITALAAGGPTGSIQAITAGEADQLYAISSGKVWFFNDLTDVWESRDHNFGTPTGLAYLNAGGKHVLLASTTDGYQEVILDVDGSLLSTLSPGSSAASSMDTDAETQYKNSLGMLYLNSILAVSDANVIPAGNGYVIYTSAFDLRYGGLWAYYSVTRKEWNRE